MREILDIEEEMRLHEASVDEIYQSMMTDVPIVSPILKGKNVVKLMATRKTQSSCMRKVSRPE